MNSTKSKKRRAEQDEDLDFDFENREDFGDGSPKTPDSRDENDTNEGSTETRSRVELRSSDLLTEFFMGPKEIEALGSSAVSGDPLLKERVDSEVDQDYLSFMLADEEYAVPITSLREIVRPRPITGVPRTVPYVLGVVTLRGVVLPVLDLRIRLGLSVCEEARSSRILVFETEDGPVGVWVDKVAEVVRIGSEPLEPPPGALGAGAEFLEGIIRRKGRMLIVLNLETSLRVESGCVARTERARVP